MVNVEIMAMAVLREGERQREEYLEESRRLAALSTPPAPRGRTRFVMSRWLSWRRGVSLPRRAVSRAAAT